RRRNCRRLPVAALVIRTLPWGDKALYSYSPSRGGKEPDFFGDQNVAASSGVSSGSMAREHTSNWRLGCLGNALSKSRRFHLNLAHPSLAVTSRNQEVGGVVWEALDPDLRRVAAAFCLSKLSQAPDCCVVGGIWSHWHVPATH